MAPQSKLFTPVLNSKMLKTVRSYFAGRTKERHLRELLSVGSLAFAMKIFGLLVTYAFSVLVTRTLGPAAMGIFALSTTMLQIFTIFGNLGFDTSLLRFVAEYNALGRRDLVKEVYVKSMKILVPVSLLLSIVLYLVAPYVAKHFFHKEHVAVYFRMVAWFLLPAVCINMNAQSLRGLKKIREFTFLQHISDFLIAAVVFSVLLLLMRNNSLPIASYMTGVLLTAVISQVLWLRHSNFFRISAGNSLKVRTILEVSIPMLLSGSMMFAMQWTSTIILGIFAAEKDVGIYNIAVRVCRLIALPLIAVNTISAPKFAEFYGKGDIRGFERIVRQSTKLIFWTSLPILLACLIAPSLILGIFGREFKAGNHALMLLTMGQFISAISGSVNIILLMTGRQKIFQNIMIATTLLHLTLSTFLVPRFGINGAAAADMVSIIIRNSSLVFAIRSALGITTIYIPFLRRKSS